MYDMWCMRSSAPIHQINAGTHLSIGNEFRTDFRILGLRLEIRVYGLSFRVSPANIYLIVHVEAPHVAPVALNYIYQVVDARVLFEQDVCVVDLVLLRSARAGSGPPPSSALHTVLCVRKICRQGGCCPPASNRTEGKGKLC